MSAYVNREVDETTVIPVNRWSQPGNYSIQIKSGTWNVESTLDFVNRGESGTYNAFEVTDSAGVSSDSSALTTGLYKAVNLPAEAIRFTESAAGVARIMQNGSSGG